MTSVRRHAGTHPIRERIVPEVSAPRPGRNGQLDWVVAGIDPHRSVPDIDERADIAGLQLIHPNRLHDSRCNLLLVEGHLHHADMGGIEQPIYMFLQPKNR